MRSGGVLGAIARRSLLWPRQERSGWQGPSLDEGLQQQLRKEREKLSNEDITGIVYLVALREPNHDV